jgi:two-component system chemotaxis sensor kinase CheA
MAQRLDGIASELQEGVMKTRMQPIGNSWSKLPRVARDLAQACGKHVRLCLEGGDTELDKTVLEAIRDPLTHLVRNAVDHGIEKTTARLAAGKPAEGLLILRAVHKGGQVHIEMNDDGAGLHRERIKQKAIALGLVSAAQVERLSDQRVIELICRPGFSTAEKVTSVSGRGVGLDVVKTNIERIGGSLDIQSVPGQGTCVRIKLPLTLAIVRALIVSAGGERFAIQQTSLQELVRLNGSPGSPHLEWVHDAPVYRLRDRLLPLVDLAAELEFRERKTWDAGAPLTIVVVQANDRRFGLVVDTVHDTQEIVVKPLGRLLQGISVLAGATILGDGKVVLILDVLGLAQQAGVISQLDQQAPADRVSNPDATLEATRSLLVCELGAGRRVALPLSHISRLEEVPSPALERSGDRQVVQCRGRILPLLSLDEVLRWESPQPQCSRETIPIVVCDNHGQNIGLIVDRIVDIVESPVDVQYSSAGRGCVGAAVIAGQVTDLLDLPSLMGA